MATAPSDTQQQAPAQVPESFIRSALNKNDDIKITDETPAKRVKIAGGSHELVTPASSQSSFAAEAPTPSPSSSYSPYSLATPMSKDQIRNLLLKEADYDVEMEKDTLKRTNYLSWDDFFMSVALLSSMRSKDPNTPTGACIVDEEYRVIGIGYNGFPRKCSDDALPWMNSNCDEDAATTTNPLHSPDPYMCHAEVNAILNKCSDNVAGATMYIPHFPCKYTCECYGGCPIDRLFTHTFYILALIQATNVPR